MNRNNQHKTGHSAGKLTIAMIIMIMAFVFAGCGGEGSSDQGSNSDAVTDGIRGVVYTVPTGWVKNDVRKGQYTSYDSPDGDLCIGVSAITDENLESFVDIQEVKTVEEYYKQRTTPSKEDTYDKEFESTSLLGQDAKTSKIKHAGGYVDIATYCMLDGIMYDFYLFRNSVYDNEGKIKDDAKVLSDEDMAIYESFIESAKTGDGASLQMEGVASDGLGEITFDSPDGFTLNALSEQLIEYESKDKMTISLVRIAGETLKYYTDENGNEIKTPEALFKQKKKTDADGEDIKIAEWEGYKVPDSTNLRSISFLTKEALYEITAYKDIDDDETNSFTKEEISAYDKFVESIRKK